MRVKGRDYGLAHRQVSGASGGLPSAPVCVLTAAALPFPLHLPLDLSSFSHSVLSSVSDLERAKQKQSRRYWLW